MNALERLEAAIRAWQAAPYGGVVEYDAANEMAAAGLALIAKTAPELKEGRIKVVPLYGKYARGQVALVDDKDYDRVMRHRWYAWEKTRGGRVDGPYATATIRINGRGKQVLMHKLLTGWPMTDHRNGNGLDNRRRNLRPATTAQNNHNQKPRTGHSSRFKGVTWHKRASKWQAAIKVNGKNHYLGVYASEEDAAAAYAAASLKAYGDYAYEARSGAA